VVDLIKKGDMNMMESRDDLMQLEGNQRLQSYLQVLGLI
jgi:hypothetical protein